MFSKLNYNHHKEEKPYIGQSLKNPQVSRLQNEQAICGLTDMPYNGASTSTAGTFERQDSLAIASSLQQRDREHFCVDFMEAELDLDNYLQCFTDLDVPADNVDLDDSELKKVNILYDGDRPYEQPELNRYEQHVAYSPGFRKPGEYDHDEYRMNCEVKADNPVYETRRTRKRAVKKPAAYEEYQDDFSSDSSKMSDGSVDDSYFEPKSKRTKATGLENFQPQTEARKYKLKPAEEKAKPIYKLKRARNNDAVRKSRNKAKELQAKKDAEYEKMKRRLIEVEGLLASEREAHSRDKELLESLLRKTSMKEQRGLSRHGLENFNK